MCTRRFSQPRRRAFRSTRGSMWNWRACGDGPDQAAEFERPQFVLIVRAAVDRAQMRRVWAASHRCGGSAPSLLIASLGGVNPRTLDHVAFWVAERDAIADYATRHLGMHVIDRQDNFTL